MSLEAVTRATDDVPSADPLAEVFWRHLLFGDWDDDDATCRCGETPPEEACEEAFGIERWHDEHLAAAVLDWLRTELAAEGMRGEVIKAIDAQADYSHGNYGTPDAATAALEAVAARLAGGER